MVGGLFEILLRSIGLFASIVLAIGVITYIAVTVVQVLYNALHLIFKGSWNSGENILQRIRGFFHKMLVLFYLVYIPCLIYAFFHVTLGYVSDGILAQLAILIGYAPLGIFNYGIELLEYELLYMDYSLVFLLGEFAITAVVTMSLAYLLFMIPVKIIEKIVSKVRAKNNYGVYDED